MTAFRADVITLFPEAVMTLADYGVCGRAISAGLVDLHCWDPRVETCDKHRTVDDRSYGGGPGMVMKVEPLRASLKRARDAATTAATTVYLSPQGEPLTHKLAQELAQLPRLILVAGRYEGVDERLLDSDIDREVSVGDFVLSGGELAALVVLDALIRLQPGALGHTQSAAQDSFSAGLLDYPHYTRPERIDDQTVPDVLLSGDHQAVHRWRMRQSLGRTWLRRPDLLADLRLDAEQQNLLNEFIREYCLAANRGASA